VIASQAVISGSFSLTRQAVQLGYMPRLRIDHTSEKEIGQVYVPSINWILMVACIGLVIGFRSSSNLAAAYGVAVSTDMVFTTILFSVVAAMRWNWKLSAVIAMATIFLTVDLAFWGANIYKVPQGGWFPLVIAAVVFTLMTTWRRGRDILDKRLREDTLPFDLFLQSLKAKPLTRVPGTAVFMFRNAGSTPPSLLHNIKHNKIVHENLILLTILTEETPHVDPDARVKTHDYGDGMYWVTAHYGFMEDPDIPHLLETLQLDGVDFSHSNTSYFLGRETLIATHRPGMAIWRERLFGWMSRNALPATYFFRLPPNRVVELGAQIEL
ncbi:MAG: KUP/HAK/KT family potassium transporter, partial [Acidobacteria bacterium]|nr:KUP/HAK/KT family potassium transporter [Acidobacteriota bacterium]